jgi:hypothetical protein
VAIAFIGIGCVSLLSGASRQDDHDEVWKLDIKEFQKYVPTFKLTDAVQIVKSNDGISRSQYGSFGFSLKTLTPELTPYENSHGEIFIYKSNKLIGHLAVAGYKNVSVAWVSEDILKVEVWPGRAVQVVVLFNASTHEIIYTSAWAHTT